MARILERVLKIGLPVAVVEGALTQTVGLETAAVATAIALPIFGVIRYFIRRADRKTYFTSGMR